MMPEENPRLPEGINVSSSHPVKDLILLSLGVCVAFVLTALVLWYSLTFIVRFVPLSWESRIADPFVKPFKADSAQQLELQERLNKILVAMDYQGESPIQVTIIESDEMNAFATLGGHIFVLTGLLNALESEMGLDMVLAHEAAHILHRDPIKSATGMLGISLVTALVTGNGNFAQTRGLMHSGNQLLFLNNSREQERAADKAALNALIELYGHIDGAEELFLTLRNDRSTNIPVILSSHPHPDERIDYILQYLKEERPQ
ncbi:M48 family metallopeptidase [Reinekea sp.]|jgi:predicted Zn-dependent protease|uniref:M48 family metallopeptidase n=1 Tax=Reinekea sp. TaxID=1970455 RepID=UPI0039894A7A